MAKPLQMKKNKLDRAFDQFISENTSRRKDDFEPYVEPFRPLNSSEVISVVRSSPGAIVLGVAIPDTTSNGFMIDRLSEMSIDFLLKLAHSCQVSYQALTGGFTICNIIVNGRLFSGSSHCIKSDRWLATRGKMNAFRRALEQSEGVELPQEKYFTSDGLVYSSE